MKTKTTSEEKKQVLLKIFEEDIEEYAKFCFPHHFKLKTPAFHREVYDLYLSDKERIAIAAPRGHAKSTITVIAFLSWCMMFKKKNFILLISDTYSQSVLLLEGLKAELEANEQLQWLFGKLTSKSWSEKEIISNGVMVRALGAGMKVRGLKYRDSRPDLIIVDDLENDEAVMSLERRQKLERWFNGALIPSMAKGGRLVMIGTILHFDSLLSKILDEEQYTEFEKRLYKAMNENHALWEDHLNLEELQVIKDRLVSKGLSFQFYHEYQNEAMSADDAKFPIEKFKFFTDADIDKKQLNMFCTIDRAYSLEKVADHTGIVVVGVDSDNNWYVIHAERYKGTEKDIIDKMFDLHSFYNIQKFGVEQKAFKYTLNVALTDEMRRRGQFMVIEELKDGGTNKNARIEGLVPRFLSGSMFFRKDQVHLIDELTKFPMSKYDDLSDALAYQLNITIAKNKRRTVKQQFKHRTIYGT